LAAGLNRNPKKHPTSRYLAPVKIPW